MQSQFKAVYRLKKKVYFGFKVYVKNKSINSLNQLVMRKTFLDSVSGLSVLLHSRFYKQFLFLFLDQ